MSWLDKLLLLSVQSGGSAIGQRPTLNFTGATVTDDSANNRVNVAITAGGLTQLTGDVTAGPGSGSVAATVAKVNGVSVTGTPTAGQVIRATSGTASSWAAVARGDISNTSGATGDIITGDATTLTRLGIGSTGQVLTVSGGAPAWANPSQTVRTTYELDFGAVPAETIINAAGSTTRTYGGVTWTFTQTGTGSAVTSAAGLTTNLQAGTAIVITSPFTNFNVLDALQGNWRIWLYNPTFATVPSGSDNFVYLYWNNLGTFGASCMRGQVPAFNANYYGESYPDASGAKVNIINSGGLAAYDILTVECVAGQFITRRGTYASGHWTDIKSCQIFTIGQLTNANLLSDTAGRNASASVFGMDIRQQSGAATPANVIKLFKVEVW